MTAKEFKDEMREATEGYGFRRGERVTVNGRVGTVNTKIVRGGGKVLQSVKFDEPDENGKYFASFDASELTPAAPVEGAPSEVDLLGQRIRRT